ncbi:Intraflagellar transport protein 88, partial [Galemys pyrenaicus]
GRSVTGRVTLSMTAVRIAGFTTEVLRDSAFDPFSQSRGSSSHLEAKIKDSLEEKITYLQKKRKKERPSDNENKLHSRTFQFGYSKLSSFEMDKSIFISGNELWTLNTQIIVKYKMFEM